MKKEDESIFFLERGIVNKTLVIKGKEYLFKFKILTNYEADKLEENFTEVNELNNSVSIDGAKLIEERLIASILDAPFDCKVGNNEFVKWNEATNDQKRVALRLLNPKIRDEILKNVIGINSLSDQEIHFL